MIKSGRPKKYPMARLGECLICKRICTTWITDGKKNRNRQYCGPTCKGKRMFYARKKVVEAKKEQEIVSTGRKRPGEVKGFTSYEEKLWGK